MATNNRIQVTLDFAADTSKAKSQIKSLQSTLDSAISNSLNKNNFGLTPQLEQARQSAMQLKIALDSAMNTDTGKLNLSKFMQQLSGSGITVKSLAADMRRLGPEGQQAFSQLGQAVAAADTRVLSLSGGIKKLVNTFANTARYQLATTAIQTMASSINEAISYTKELDKSLTDIGIVTNRSSQNLAKFAKEANKAARELSTTTNEYAKASLIYFQQGLSDSEVKKRTEITVKLAQAVGASSSEVSEWMTAIWNNFDDGSKSLEHYANVLASLGAATASSADEIAGGLEKFAAVAETVGLSYEYAASMLATITAETRQSEEVVGTALKTILSRMEGLKLGNTLDDGTTLNQYSQALASVGVNIKDTSGELKNMDQILDETAMKWQTLSKDQQVALAQSVAGVRQYTQFISLMSNWDVMEQNVALAKSSAGALNTMSNTYANSIEAAEERATNAAEKLYDTLFNSKTIKTFYNNVEKTLDVVTSLAEAFGGIPGILARIVPLFLKLYQPKITQFFTSMGQTAMDTFSKMGNAVRGKGWVSTRQQDFQKEVIDEAYQMEYGMYGGTQSAKISKEIAQTKMQLINLEGKLTPQQQQQAEWQLQALEAVRDRVREEEKELEVLRMQNAEREDGLRDIQLSINSKVSETKAPSEKALGALDTQRTGGGNSVWAIGPMISAMETNKEDRTNYAFKMLANLEKFEEQAEPGAFDKTAYDEALQAISDFADGVDGSIDQIQKAMEKLKQGVVTETTQETSAKVDVNTLTNQANKIGHLQSQADSFVFEGLKTDMTREGLNPLLEQTQQDLTDIGISAEDFNVDEVFSSILKEKNDNIKLATQAFAERLGELAKMAIEDAAKAAVPEGAGGDAKTLGTLSSLQGNTDIDQGKRKEVYDKLNDAMGKQSNQKSAIQDKKKKMAGIVDKKKLEEEKKALEKLENELKDTENELQDARKAASQFFKEINKDVPELENIDEDIEQSEQAFQSATDEAKEYATHVANAAQATENLEKKSDRAGKSAASIGEQAKNSINNLSNQISTGLNDVVSFASGIMTLGSAFSSLNDKVDSGTATLQDYISTAIAAASSIGQMVGPIFKVVGAIAAKIAMRKASKKASKDEANQEQKDSIKGVIASFARGAAGVGENAGKGYAFWPAAIAGAAVLTALGAAVAVGALSGAGVGTADEEQAAQASQASLDSMSEHVDDLKSSYEELNKAIENYVSKQNAIEKMVEGTKEWKQAIAEANAEVLELVKNYPELATMIETTGGRLTFKDGALDELADQQYNEIQRAQASQTLLQIGANQSQSELAQAELKKKQANVGDNIGTTAALYSAAVLLGPAVLLAPVIAAVGAIKTAKDYVEAEKMDQGIDELFDLYVAQDVEAYTAKLEEVANGDEALKQEIQALIESQAQLAETNNLLRLAYIQQTNADNEKYANSQYRDYLDYFKSKQIDPDSKEYKSQESEIRKQVEKLREGKDEDFAKAYLAEVLGEDVNKITGGTDGTNDVRGENYRITHLGGGKFTLWKKTSDDTWEKVDDKNNTYKEKDAADKLVQARMAKFTNQEIEQWESRGTAINSDLQAAGIERRKGETESEYQARLTQFGLAYLNGDTLDFSKLTRAERDALTTDNIADKDMAAAINEGKEKYEEMRRKNNLIANSEWVEKTEERETAELQSILNDAGMDKQTFDNYVKSFSQYGKAAEDVAKKTLKTSNAVNNLHNIFDKNKEVFKKPAENAGLFAQQCTEVQNELTKWLGVDLGYDYVVDNLETIQKAAEGDAKAIKELQLAAARKIVVDMDIPEEEANKLNELINQVESQNIEIGASIGAIDDQGYIDSLNKMLETGEITAEQATAYLNSIGYDPDITTEKIDQNQVIKYSYTDPISNKPISGEITITKELEVPVINPKGTTYTGNRVTKTPSSGSTSSSGGGGASKKKNADEEIERYHHLDKTIQDITRSMNKYAEAKERAFGQSYLDYLAQEIAAGEELIRINNEKLNQAQQYLASDRAALAQYGASFDENGNISNYDEMFAAQIAQYNSNPEAYEESYGQFVQAVQQYEDSLQVVKDLEDEGIRLLNANLNRRLEGIAYTVDIKLKIDDHDLKTIEFLMDNLDDTAESAAEKFALMGKSMETYMQQAQTNLNAIAETLGLSDIDLQQILANPDAIEDIIKDKNLTDEQISQLYDYAGNLQDATKNMKQLQEEIPENLISLSQEMNEELEESLDKIDHLNTMIESYRNLLDLAGRDALGINDELMIQMAKSQFNISSNGIKAQKEKLEANKEKLLAVQKEIADAEAKGDKDRVESLKKVEDEVIATIQEDSQALIDMTTQGLEAATLLFEEEMNSIFRTFENNMTGLFGNFNQFLSIFEQQKELNSFYLEDYQQIYELSKLNRDILKSIDASDSITAKQKLRDLQQEINDLQESGAQMTQYEVDALRAKYELRLAEIALEEAQNAKSSVRMQRDSEGNWGYVYTADQNQIDTAQQNLEDKLYNYQNLTQNRTNELVDLMASIPQQFQEAITSIYQDQTLSDEEKYRAIAEVQSHYQQMYANVVQQLQLSNMHAAELYNEDWLNYSNMTGYKISSNEQWIDNFEETVYSQMTGFTSLDAAQSAFTASTSDSLVRLQIKYSDYREQVKQTLDLGLNDIETFIGSEETEGSLLYYLQMAEDSSKEAADEAERIGEENANAFKTAVDAASQWLEDYGKTIDEWVGKTVEVSTAVGQVATAYSQLSANIQTVVGDYQQLAEAQKGLEQSGGTGGDDSYTSYTPSYPAGDPNDTGIPDDPRTAADESDYRQYENNDNVNLDSDDKSTINAEGFSNDPFATATYGTPARLGQNAYIYQIKDGKFKRIEPNEYKAADTILHLEGQKKLKWVNGEGKEKSKAVFFKREGYNEYYHSSNFANPIPSELMKKLQQLDTGGYTGEWDSSGRLALLHQKEIVLNAHDTANFLAGINILRDITAAIDLQALSQRQMLSTLSAPSIGVQSQALEQQITIHAEFPSATEHSEIEAAFDSLLNRASQFANRKK